MNTWAIIYLVILLLFLIGAFIFFIMMDLKNHKKNKDVIVNNEAEINSIGENINESKTTEKDKKN